MGDTDNAGNDPSGKREAFPLAWLAYPTRAEGRPHPDTSTAYTTGTHPVCLTSVQWADPSGSTLIVAWSAESQTSSSVRFGVFANGRFTALPTPPGVYGRSPPYIAW